jgi:hypothetical protein
MEPSVLLARVLFLFGVGFLAANAKVIADLVRFWRRKPSAQLTWTGAKPKFYGFTLGLGVMLGALLAFKIFYQRRPPDTLFGEAMMFVYYGYAFPLSTRIERGFYRDGIWTDSGFMRWKYISAVSWKEEGQKITLILISRARSIARRLDVPGPLYGQARRVLRDKVKAHDIHIGGAGLDLGSRDESDAI